MSTQVAARPTTDLSLKAVHRPPPRIFLPYPTQQQSPATIPPPLCDLFRPAQQQPPLSNRSHPLAADFASTTNPTAATAVIHHQHFRTAPLGTPGFRLAPDPPRRLLASDSLRTRLLKYGHPHDPAARRLPLKTSHSLECRSVLKINVLKSAALYKCGFPTAPTSDKNTSDPKTHILLRTLCL
jgi:hypothetical protein